MHVPVYRGVVIEICSLRDTERCKVHYTYRRVELLRW